MDVEANYGTSSPLSWGSFGRFWFQTLAAILIREIHEPVLAVDLATEAFATARLEWPEPPTGEDGIVALIALASRLLVLAADRRTVPSTARRRGRGVVEPLHLSVEQQRQLTALSEEILDLPPRAREAAAALARESPPPPQIARILPSGLIEPDSLPEPDSLQEPDRSLDSARGDHDG